jgi:hypothetical protein
MTARRKKDFETGDRVPDFVDLEVLRYLRLASLLDALIEGLQHPCIDCGDHIHSRVQLFFRHACFPCIRKAPIHSRIAEPHHCDREADQHLLALSEAFDGVRIAVECPKIGFFHVIAPVRERAQDAAPLRSQTSALVPQH